MNAPAHKPRSRWRNFFLVAGPVVLLFVVPPLALYLYYWYDAERTLQQAIAETDRLDPRWRLEDIEADRAVVPEEENAALVVLEVVKLLPVGWANKPVFTELFEEDPPPQCQLTEKQAAALRDEFRQLRPALAEARKLAERKRGRFPGSFVHDWFGATDKHAPKVREVASLLQHDAMWRVQDGDAQGAWCSSWSILNVGESLGDEPSLISFLVRAACRYIAIASLERTLAQGNVPAPSLARAQRLLEEEAAEKLLVPALRGQRAGMHQTMERIRSGQLGLEDLMGKYDEPTLVQKVPLAVTMPLLLKEEHAKILVYLNRAIAICDEPVKKRELAWQKLEGSLKGTVGPARVLTSTYLSAAKMDTRTQAQLRCTITALALERYRLKYGRYPEIPESLVREKLLTELPRDPYGGKPLRYRRTRDGVVVYSIGPQGKGRGDYRDRAELQPGEIALEFRLWDPDQRRQPPRPPKKKPVEPPDDDG